MTDDTLPPADAEAQLRVDKRLATQDAIHSPNPGARVEVPLLFRALLES